MGQPQVAMGWMGTEKKLGKTTVNFMQLVLFGIVFRDFNRSGTFQDFGVVWRSQPTF